MSAPQSQRVVCRRATRQAPPAQGLPIPTSASQGMKCQSGSPSRLGYQLLQSRELRRHSGDYRTLAAGLRRCCLSARPVTAPASRTPALAYLRTSSATNVGADKDSEKRQRAAIEGYAKRAGFALVGEFYDEAVSGADASRRARASPPSWTGSTATAFARSLLRMQAASPASLWRKSLGSLF